MVRQKLGVAIINPLSAMEEVGRGLAIRPLQLSVPYRVMLIRPDYRPSSSFVEGFCQSLRIIGRNEVMLVTAQNLWDAANIG